MANPEATVDMVKDLGKDIKVVVTITGRKRWSLGLTLLKIGVKMMGAQVEIIHNP